MVAFGRAQGALPADPAAEAPPKITPLALVVLEETLRPDAAETIAFMREQKMDLKLISGDARETVTAVAASIGVPADAGVVEGDRAPRRPRRARRGRRAQHDLLPDPARAEEGAGRGARRTRGRFTAMIGDGVNDVPALKQARMAVAMGSGSQITKGIADIVLLKDQFSRLPRAVAEGRRIARNIHRLGRLYVTKTVYAATLIAVVAIPGLRLPLPAPPPDARRVPDDRDPLASCSPSRPATARSTAGSLLRALALVRGARPGLAIAAGSLASFFLVDTVFGGTLEEGRTAATTTLVILGLSFILLLERGPGREHIAIQSYMLALVAALGALYALALAVEPLRHFFELTQLGGGQLFLALLSVGRRPGARERRLAPARRSRGSTTPHRRGASRQASGHAERADGRRRSSATSTGRWSTRTTSTRSPGTGPSASTRSPCRSGASTARSGWAATSSSRRWPATTSRRRRATTSATPRGPCTWR